MRRLVFCVATIALVLLTGAGIAAAATPTIEIQPESGTPGTTVSFSGSRFTPSGRVSVLLIEGLGLIVSEQKAGPDGTISGSFTIPRPGDAAELTYGKVAVFAIDEESGQESNRAYLEIAQQPLLPKAGGGESGLLIAGIIGIILLAAGAAVRLRMR